MELAGSIGKGWQLYMKIDTTFIKSITCVATGNRIAQCACMRGAAIYGINLN